MEFFDGWKTLNARFDEGDLTALTQLVGYKLYAIFDEHRFPDSLPLSDRELQDRTGIQSGQTIVAARRHLKNAGLIDFDTRQGKKTVYRLTLNQSRSHQEAIKKLSSSYQAVAGSSYIHAHDPYPLSPNSSNDDDNAGGRAGVNRNFENGVTATPLDEVEEFWSRTLKGGQLSIEHLSEIQMLIDRHGIAWVKEAMRDASNANGNGLNMNLFRGVVRRKLNPVKPALKGGERRDRGNESARRNVVALPDTYDPARDPVDWRQYLTGTGTSAERP